MKDKKILLGRDVWDGSVTLQPVVSVELYENATYTIEALVDGLREIEWSGQIGVPICPRCRRTEDEKHQKDCPLHALLESVG